MDIDTQWLWFSAFWLVAFMWLAYWHVFSYVRVRVTMIAKAVPYTLCGAALSLGLTALIAWTAELRNPIGIALVVAAGSLLAQIVSVRLHDLTGRNRRERIRSTVLECDSCTELESSGVRDGPPKPWTRARITHRNPNRVRATVERSPADRRARGDDG